MTADRVRGKAQQATGKVKEQAGRATGNEKLEGEGMADQVEGKGREIVGKAKGVAKKVRDKVR